MLRHLPLTPNAPSPGYRRLPKPFIAELRSAAQRIVRLSRRQKTIPTLDQLPLEILHEIFAYASTDGGLTARSLSLVSRKIYAASRATHFTSVSLVSGSMNMLSNFLQHFRQAQEVALEQGHQKPRVRHLCILVDPVTCFSTSLFLFGFDAPQTSRIEGLWQEIRKEEKKRTEEEWLTFVVELENEYHRVVSDILNLVAEDLETLCLLQLENFLTPKNPYCLWLNRPDFPKLRELWCTRNLPPMIRICHTATIFAATFPSLTRFHILEPTYPDFPRWRRCAPNVDSFRIILSSWVFEHPNSSYLPALQGGLSIRDWPIREPVHVISPGPHTISDSFEPFYRWHAAKFRKVIHDAGSRVVFVPHYTFQDAVDSRNASHAERHYPASIARRDWLARISAEVGVGTDGAYTRDFWLKYSEQNHRGSRLDRKLMRRAKRVDGQVMPLVRWQREGDTGSVVS
ncbi:hypothetical protein L226DRAFT_529188 [Lentinus tigrinus ALCF2SS1-7]|uniref:F-box domain-containing protein n=1 Tax=Lentinus tigrinus ALCF2SS1-6 TaxID=1328759 RepID=A0A5C2SSA9_9APHY|nr:hypothetical protein L227DRAFT_568999 [Lentinus tigrinus ALCF2SS1-6]RPD80726.1 hypothetical protein L226DRAFT_529188 [Lentinus tigrinus ALCF2SS1-7]